MNLRGKKAPPVDLDYRFYGFTEADMEREFHLEPTNPQGILSKKKNWKLGELINAFREKYCQTLGVERSHITNTVESDWLVNKVESDNSVNATLQEKKDFFESLQWSSLWEEWIHKKFTTTKRFSASGSDTLVPALQFLIDKSIEQGAEKIIIGMPHRGRMNVLGKVLNKPLHEILTGFISKAPEWEDSWGNAGDVKYHIGFRNEYTTPSGKKVIIQVMPNASHLESVDPVATGFTRCEQDMTGDKDRKKIIGILIHGDAAFSGQGIVYETMQFSALNNYNIGGTIHLVVNNQIGFTTVPRDSRTGEYCTEIAKSIGAPIFHVNGEDPEAVIKSTKIVSEYRMKFNKDVVIDLVGYRLYGHNEMDQPAFTQPLMYKRVAAMRRIYDKVLERYLAEGIIKKEESDKKAAEVIKHFEQELVKAKEKPFKWSDWVQTVTKRTPKKYPDKNTGVKIDKLREINEKINVIPKSFAAHPTVRKGYEARYKSVVEGAGIDWATGEALAFATLLLEGHNIRISGQDVQRGTFSHRHSYLHHQEKDEVYIPLRNLGKDAGLYRACNSSLSELGVLGFEYGFSLADPNNLVLWEGQFGDFANGGQLITDQYVSAAEAKWGVQSGLVMLLPHGFDGQGAEHSSARLERYLQLCDDEPYSCRLPGHLNRDTNMQVVSCTTPGNYFHVLRRQLRRDYRKPLINMSPKRMLRLRECQSDITEFGEGRRFRTVIPDVNPNLCKPEDVHKVIMCSGQVYYDLAKARDTLKRNRIAIVRLEQIAPFPVMAVTEQFNKYKNARIVWCQEEHFNAGPWFFVEPRANNVNFPHIL